VCSAGVCVELKQLNESSVSSQIGPQQSNGSLSVPLQRAAEESRKYVHTTMVSNAVQDSSHTGFHSDNGCRLDYDEDGDDGMGRTRGRGGPNPSIGKSEEVASKGSAKYSKQQQMTAVFQGLRGAAAQLQALGYEAGVWDLMGTVVLARRALEGLTLAVTSI